MNLKTQEFMDRHPGGPTTILAWAGKEASKFFNEIHKGVKIDAYLRPEAFLGDLGVDENLMSEHFGTLCARPASRRSARRWIAC